MDKKELQRLQQQLDAILAETGLRKQARLTLAGYREFMEPTGLDDYQHPFPRHLELVAEKLEAVERGDIRRLLVMMPPGCGKSFLCSSIFPSWYMALHPERLILAASNTADLAEEFSRRRKLGMLEPRWEVLSGTSIDPNRQALSSFGTLAGGSITAVGVSGACVGRRADLLILDDPISSWAEAMSVSQCDRLWNWLETEFRSRLKPNGAIVIVSTAWSSNDPSQRIVRLVEEGAEEWEVLRLPWECDDPISDPLQREQGAPLWPGHYSDERIERVKRNPRDWNAYWQQRPADSSQEWYPSQNLKVQPPPPDQRMTYYLGVDLALTVSGGDYTALAVCALDAERNFHIVHIERFRRSGDFTVKRIIELAKKHPFRTALLDNDPSSKQFRTLYREITHNQRAYGVVLHEVPMKNRNKEARAAVFRSLLWEDRVRLNPGPHTAAFLSELSEFPGGSASPDQIDAISCVCNYIPRIASGKAEQTAESLSEEFQGAIIQQENGKMVTAQTMGELFNDHAETLSLSRQFSRRRI